ncbi:MAG: hypothetical protein NC251_01885 [Lachnoclostridium sp.]|nr:hypothetical protein [Lachnospira sp.]MCM1247159.1 hypothetical protein [Lachnoclostridium sp.]
MSAENQAAAQQTFDFQAMDSYNVPRSGSKAAQADLDSAPAESFYHERRKSSGCTADI